MVSFSVFHLLDHTNPTAERGNYIYGLYINCEQKSVNKIYLMTETLRYIIYSSKVLKSDKNDITRCRPNSCQ